MPVVGVHRAQQPAAGLNALRSVSGYSIQQIINLGEQQVPRAAFKKASLSDWFNGRAVPGDAARFRRLVELLEARAERSPGHHARTVRDWEQLRKRARDESRPRPAAAPASRTPAAPPQQLPPAPGDTAKAGRVLAALPPGAPWLRSLRTNPTDRVHITHSAAFDNACDRLRAEVVVASSTFSSSVCR
ncbi:hypothetical protein ACGFZP_31445 [Kitasatospora sp. NPDC048239]|uniref:hypothetical protein n=1 Tax=Kitasatospora sp. NPDC048239 TaxID=3364046 RepID=UPI0037217175